MKKMAWALAVAVAFCVANGVAAQQPSANEQAAFEAQLRSIAERLHPQGGDIRIPSANAVLHLGEDYYFLPATEARLVLTDAWGNPAEATNNVLGMVFPAGKTFADDTWGAVITFENSGYVSDADAQSTDYDALLEQMRDGEAEANAERSRLGYPAQHLVGWAQAPTYDSRGHSLVWARNIQFAGQAENTLNYDIRLLGRRGVLSLNLVAGMNDLEETREAARQFAAAAEFVAGNRYADFQPGTDRTAEYGIAGLIAAGTGAAVAKKAGLVALILAFGKKFIVLLLAGVAIVGGALRRMFKGRSEETEASYDPTYDEAAFHRPNEVAAESELPVVADNAAPGIAGEAASASRPTD